MEQPNTYTATIRDADTGKLVTDEAELTKNKPIEGPVDLPDAEDATEKE